MSPRGPVDSTLVTGFPSYTARRMLLKLLVSSKEQAFMLVRDKHAADAEEFVASLAPGQQKRLSVLVGDVSSMDLGLSGKEYRSLASELTNVHHMAAHLHLGASKEMIQQVNVGGTRGVLELALECRRLRRFNYWSTIHVSGDREGVIMEDELALGQSFHNPHEHSKYAAEKVVRSMSRRVPSTIFRPGIIVGDSKTGEIDRFDGPYRLMVLIVDSPIDVHLPLPGKGTAPLHLVPIDYVIDAAYELSRAEEAVSKTFHIVDPCPLSARSVYELVAERAHRKAPRGVIPAGIARTLLKLPFLSQTFGNISRTMLAGFEQNVYYNCRHTLEALRQTDVWCPPFEGYVDNLVRFVKDERAARRRRLDDDITDPLDSGG
jgi:thioester reductase-like protein